MQNLISQDDSTSMPKISDNRELFVQHFLNIIMVLF